MYSRVHDFLSTCFGTHWPFRSAADAQNEIALPSDATRLTLSGRRYTVATPRYPGAYSVDVSPQEMGGYFLGLPAELRNMIYFLDLPTNQRFYLHQGPRYPRVPALLQTCQQIRIEAMQIWRGTNIFCHFRHWGSDIPGRLVDLSTCGLEQITCLRLSGGGARSIVTMEANVAKGDYHAIESGNCGNEDSLSAIASSTLLAWVENIERLTGRKMRRVQAPSGSWLTHGSKI